jgi:hypothetical protein
MVVSIPLMFRWIPPNRLFGFRVPATLRNRSIWYDANARSARHFFALGAFMVLLEFALPVAIRTQTLRVVAIGGMLVITIVDWRTANRWERERRSRS